MLAHTWSGVVTDAHLSLRCVWSPAGLPPLLDLGDCACLRGGGAVGGEGRGEGGLIWRIEL